MDISRRHKHCGQLVNDDVWHYQYDSNCCCPRRHLHHGQLLPGSTESEEEAGSRPAKVFNSYLISSMFPWLISIDQIYSLLNNQLQWKPLNNSLLSDLLVRGSLSCCHKVRRILIFKWCTIRQRHCINMWRVQHFWQQFYSVALTGHRLLRQTQLPRWFRRLGEKLNQWWWWWRWERRRERRVRRWWRWQKLDKLFKTGPSRQSKIGQRRQFPQISAGRSCSGSNVVKRVGWRLFLSQICSKTSQELEHFEHFDSTALPSLCENRSLAELIWTSTI